MDNILELCKDIWIINATILGIFVFISLFTFMIAFFVFLTKNLGR